MKDRVKEKMRQEMMHKRKGLSREFVNTHSKGILDTLLKMPAFKFSRNNMIYLSFKNEVDTHAIIEVCRKMGKRVCVPYCVPGSRDMIASEMKDPQRELVRNAFGYLEPAEKYIRPVDKEEIDLVIVPGLIFDKRGYRIGYGGGYYDRFLSGEGNNPTTIGVAYDFQIIDRVPTEEYDIPLDYIITEKRIIVR